jgi:hypothetical protein
MICQEVESIKKITTGNDLGKMCCNFVNQVKPDSSSFLVIHGAIGKVGHPLFYIPIWLGLFDVLQNLDKYRSSKVLYNKTFQAR